MRTTNLTHGLQGRQSEQMSFYRRWAVFYEMSVKLDPAFQKNLRKMIDLTVSEGDDTLDIGCGTGLGTVYAAKVAQKVLALDPSHEMLKKLVGKIERQNFRNIRLCRGVFPEAVQGQEKFDSVISSFMLVHLLPEKRSLAIKAMSDILNPGGKIGLFSARGEAAPAFETREELHENLSDAGFRRIKIHDVDDVYRISTGEK